MLKFIFRLSSDFFALASDIERVECQKIEILNKKQGVSRKTFREGKRKDRRENLPIIFRFFAAIFRPEGNNRQIIVR